MATSTSTSTEWSPSSWRNKKVYQQPTYMDPVALDSALAQVQEYPPLVHVSEVELLKTELARVARGEKFLLQGGDCAERFLDCRQKPIEDKIKILLQMSLVMTYVGHMPVVRVARMAGQYAKPRSSNTEVVDGQEVLSFRGDNVNSFSAKDRNPDPQRLISAYFHSSATLNYTRAVLAGGFGNLRNPELWDFEYVKDKALLNEYKTICANILDSLHFFETLESTSAMPESTLRGVNMYTSHEGLLLPYEEALTRPIANYGHTTGASRYKYYNSGAHFLWIGDRTRQLDGAHIEYFSGIANPIGIKVGPTSDPAELVQLVAKLNPTNEAGKITLITRCGAGKVEECLPKFILAIKASGHTVVWSCDPMHGNTNTVNGYKTRKFDDVFSEVIRTLEIHEKLGTILGGVHLEMTGENVTECLGGSGEISQDHLPERYHTYCDPRLNYTQSLDLAFALSKHMKTRREQLHPLI